MHIVTSTLRTNGMAVSKGKLDDLMGTTYTSADYQSLAILSVTDDSSSNLSTVTALTTGAPAPGSVSGETFKVVSFNDANDTVTLLEGTPYGTTVGTTTLNVIAFSSSGLLLIWLLAALARLLRERREWKHFGAEQFCWRSLNLAYSNRDADHILHQYLGQCRAQPGR